MAASTLLDRSLAGDADLAQSRQGARRVFGQLAAELNRLRDERQQTLERLFDSLYMQRRHLAALLLEQFGSPARAAQWMVSHHRPLGGRSPLDVLADGDEDTVWDLLSPASGEMRRADDRS